MAKDSFPAYLLDQGYCRLNACVYDCFAEWTPQLHRRNSHARVLLSILTRELYFGGERQLTKAQPTLSIDRIAKEVRVKPGTVEILLKKLTTENWITWTKEGEEEVHIQAGPQLLRVEQITTSDHPLSS